MKVKSLDERIKERNATHRKFLAVEHKVQPYIDKLATVLPENTKLELSLYADDAYFHISLDSVEEFEEKYITPISEMFAVVWRREVEADEIAHRADIVVDVGGFEIYMIVRSKPTDSCRITKIATGKSIKVAKTVYVEEAEFDYVVECSDD